LKRCLKDDKEDPCATDGGGDDDKIDAKYLSAYAINPPQSTDKYSQISFCQPFFDQRSLTNAVAYGTGHKQTLPGNDIRNYRNRGMSTLFFFLAPFGSTE
jgi:hypothetical protein